MCVDSEKFYIVTDSQHMNMREYVNSFYKILTEVDIKKIIRLLAQAIQYCHQNGVMHRDIKLDNILVSIDEDGIIYDLKLADFGKAVRFDTNSKFSGLCGTVGYMAPEQLKKS